jgi:hypothetical protein
MIGQESGAVHEVQFLRAWRRATVERWAAKIPETCHVTVMVSRLSSDAARRRSEETDVPVVGWQDTQALMEMRSPQQNGRS